MLQRMILRDWLFFGVMAVGVVAAIYHMMNNRVMNGVLALLAIGVGIVVRFIIIRSAQRDQLLRERQLRSGERPDRGSPGDFLRAESDADGDIWMRSGVIAGFFATVVMSGVLIAGYLSAGIFADEDGGTIAEWFYGLTHNQLTDDAFDIPLGSYSINLLAGVVWGLVYGAFFESKLRGPSWWRGVKFSILPWLLSLIVFFPLVGAGFFGADLGAGPLPAIGNLILHLAYGAVLGWVYAMPATIGVGATEHQAHAYEWEDRGLAFGLTAGLILGMTIGAVLGLIFGDGAFNATEFILAGAAAGIMAGGIFGPFIGLDYGSDRAPDVPSS